MDRRERNHQWYSSFDPKRMVLVLEEGRKLEHPKMECFDCGYDGDDVQDFISSEVPGERKCPKCNSENCHMVELEDVEIPAKWEVCETCDGKGSHVNPAIDSHGLSREDFDEDPDFAEAYWRGDYDQQCNECHGRTTVPVPDEERAGPELMKLVNDHLQDLANMRAEEAAERRMGA